MQHIHDICFRGLRREVKGRKRNEDIYDELVNRRPPRTHIGYSLYHVFESDDFDSRWEVEPDAHPVQTLEHLNQS
jgi:hypothetical protein